MQNAMAELTFHHFVCCSGMYRKIPADMLDEGRDMMDIFRLSGD